MLLIEPSLALKSTTPRAPNSDSAGSWVFKKLPRLYQTTVSLPPDPFSLSTGCKTCGPWPSTRLTPWSAKNWALLFCAAFTADEYSVPQRILTIMALAPAALASAICLLAKSLLNTFTPKLLGEVPLFRYVVYDKKANLTPLISNVWNMSC